MVKKPFSEDLEQVKQLGKKGFSSISKYYKFRLKERGFNSQRDYLVYLYKKKGLEYPPEYNKRIRKKKKKELSRAIRNGLDKTGKNFSWLAKEIGTTREAVSKYSQGAYLPRKKIIIKLGEILEFNSKTLEKLL